MLRFPLVLAMASLVGAILVAAAAAPSHLQYIDPGRDPPAGGGVAADRS